MPRAHAVENRAQLSAFAVQRVAHGALIRLIQNGSLHRLRQEQISKRRCALSSRLVTNCTSARNCAVGRFDSLGIGRWACGSDPSTNRWVSPKPPLRDRDRPRIGPTRGNSRSGPREMLRHPPVATPGSIAMAAALPDCRPRSGFGVVATASAVKAAQPIAATDQRDRSGTLRDPQHPAAVDERHQDQRRHRQARQHDRADKIPSGP